jgi:hypothetical protein
MVYLNKEPSHHMSGVVVRNVMNQKGEKRYPKN